MVLLGFSTDVLPRFIEKILRYLWLSAIAKHLSPPAQEIWRSLSQKFGDQEEEHLDPLFRSREVIVVQQHSPADHETLTEWSAGDIVRYCLAFTGPEESFDRPSKEGLAEAVLRQVQTRPKEFIPADAPDLAGCF